MTDEVSHCIELTTGERHSGILRMGSDRIELSLYSYANESGQLNPITIKEEKPLHLYTENGKYVTFSDFFVRSKSSVNQIGLGGGGINKVEIVSNDAIFGDEKWEDDDQVWRVEFSLDGIDYLFRDDVRYPAIMSNFNSDVETNIFAVPAKYASLSAFFFLTTRSDPHPSRTAVPRFVMDFKQPRLLKDFEKDVFIFRAFFTFITGHSLIPDRVEIDPIGVDQIKEKLRDLNPHHSFVVKHLWQTKHQANRRSLINEAPIWGFDGQELDALKSCLAIWMDRSSEWLPAYLQMGAGFGRSNAVNEERLLDAYKWFEVIPITKEEMDLSSEGFERIKDPILSSLQPLNLTQDFLERIKNAISRVRYETAKSRFERLVSTVEKKFGEGCLPKTAVEDLVAAGRLRGTRAHQANTDRDDASIQKLIRSVYALEAFCLLLTACDLPLSQAGVTRMKEHPIVKRYLRL